MFRRYRPAGHGRHHRQNRPRPLAAHGMTSDSVCQFRLCRRPAKRNRTAVGLSKGSPCPTRMAPGKPLGLPSLHYPCGHGPFNRSTTIITRSPLQALAAQLLLFLVLLTGALAVSRSDANDFDLPVLGDATSGVISLQQEFELGRAWLRAFRSRVQTLDDPELQLYLEQLLYDLAGYSALDNPR